MSQQQFDIFFHNELIASITKNGDFNQILLNRVTFCLHSLANNYMTINEGSSGPLKVVLDVLAIECPKTLAELIKISEDMKVVQYYVWANILMNYLSFTKVVLV